jgi:hypothetical protein
MKKAAEYMVNAALREDKNLCYRAPAARIHGYEYYMLMFLPEERFHRIKHRMDNKADCVFFSVSQIDDKTPIDRDYADDFSFAKKHNFGRVAVWEIEPMEVFMNWEEIEKQKKKSREKEVEEKEDGELSDSRDKPEEITKENNNSSNQEKEEEKEQKEYIEKPERHERVLWKGVFE